MRKKEAPISTRIPDTPLEIFNPPRNPRSRRNSALRRRENLRETIEWGDSAEGKPTQAGGGLPEDRAVRLLKLTDGTRFQ